MFFYLFYFIILIMYFVAIIIIFTKNKKNINRNLKSSPTSILSNYYRDFYEPNKYIITNNELAFYKVLNEIASELNLTVFAQVSLYHIIHTKKELNKNTKERFFRRISQKSIDFVLVNPENCEIKLCIELDDTTHKMPERVSRDNFLNDLFRQLDINLLRYRVFEDYYKVTLKRRILEILK